MSEPRHVVVVGLMGSGKTTVGAAIAKRLGWPHRDSDRDLGAAEGRTARAIADARGIEHLHALELRQLFDALGAPAPSVISAAASVIDVPAGRAALADRTVQVVWLRIGPATAASRIRAPSEPGDDGDEARDHRPSPEPIEEQARRRDPLFASVADVVIDASLPVESIVRLATATDESETD